MRQVLSLDEKQSFSVIQTQLFMKFCAKKELEKAKGDLPKSHPLDLIMVRSFKNQFKDSLMQWKNLFGYIKYSWGGNKRD